MMAGIGEFLTRGARKLGEAGLTDADRAAARALHSNMDNSTRLERMMHNNGVLTAGDVKSRLFSSAMTGGAVAAPFGWLLPLGLDLTQLFPTLCSLLLLVLLLVA